MNDPSSACGTTLADHLDDIDWSRPPSSDYETRLRQAYLLRLAERESRFTGSAGFAYFALCAIAMKYDTVADDLREAIATWKGNMEEQHRASRAARHAEIFQQAQRDVIG
jgi:hypothetical protein